MEIGRLGIPRARGCWSCLRRDWHRDVADHLRNRHPLGHAFAACHVGDKNAATGNVALQVGESVRPVFLTIASDEIIHWRPVLCELNSVSILLDQTNLNYRPKPADKSAITL